MKTDRTPNVPFQTAPPKPVQESPPKMPFINLPKAGMLSDKLFNITANAPKIINGIVTVKASRIAIK